MEQTIKEIGVIDLDRVEASSGRIETFVPMKVVDEKLGELLETLEADFKKKHPSVKNIVFTIHVIYIYGEVDSPRFELEVIIWNENESTEAEFYEEIEVNLSEQASKVVKKTIWDALGKTFFNL